MNVTSGKVKHVTNLKFQYIPEHFPKLNITAREFIMHMGSMEGLRDSGITKKSNELFHLFFMESMIDIPMKHLSKGTLQKVGVIQALLAEPDVILLDEPLSGQDIQSQNQFISIIKDWNNRGITVLMSCHEIFLVNQLSKHIFEINNGSLTRKLISIPNHQENDVLIFLKEKNNVILPMEVQKLIRKVEINETEIILLVSENNSNEVILKMLQSNFKIRSMNHG